MTLRKIHRTILFLGLAILLKTNLVVAQSDLFEQAYLILTTGDTLFGFVKDPANRSDLHLSVTYSENQAGENPVTYSPFEVVEYYYEPGFCFISRETSLPDDPEKLFFQCLVRGYASLYQYETGQKQVFLLEKRNEPALYIVQPAREETMDLSSREKLDEFVSDCGGLITNQDMQFTVEDLIRLMKQYNRCSQASKEMVVYKMGKDRKFRIGVTMGINLSDLTIFDDSIPYHDMNLKIGMGFNVGLGMEVYFLKRFTFNVKAMWVSYNASLWNQEMPNDTAVRKDDLLLNFSYLDFPVKLKVNLTDDRFTTFLFAGAWFGILVEEDIAAQSTIPEFSTTWSLNLDKLKQGYTAGFGLSIPASRRSEISFEAGYIYQKAKAGNSDGLSFQNFFLQMSYLF
jgi:hypothetical protein